MRLFANLQSYPSPALFQVILSAMSFPSVDIDRRLFVSKGGNDSNKGSPNAPFLTIGAAIASIDTWAIAPSAADPVLCCDRPRRIHRIEFRPRAIRQPWRRGIKSDRFRDTVSNDIVWWILWLEQYFRAGH